jgi:hypothetical protein
LSLPRARQLWLWLGLSLAPWCLPAPAAARVARFALIVGSDRGQADEALLQYAQSDARKVHATLRDIGDFEPFNMVLLEGSDADAFRRTLIDLNDRVRAARSQPGTQVVLFVYYSGHADVEDLHLGDTRLSIAELSQLVRGSAADFRLLVLDACRSGTLTRSKGGRITHPFDIPAPIQLSGEGLAFLTASADNELAQESDEVRGSFFTHALVSGLLGAADRDRDGNVVLDEAYQYAYENTLRASSRSASGLQHPTFFYDLRGQGQLVLTRPFAPGMRRGVLELPRAATYLVFRGDAQGQVMAELAARDPVRSLSLAPGAYFVRGRTSRHVLEGGAQVTAGQATRVDERALTRIEYAHLVRKGHDSLRRSHAIALLGLGRLPLPNADSGCYGAFGGYRLDLRSFGVLASAGGCVSNLESIHLRARTREIDFGLRGLHAFDLGARSSLDAGLGVGAARFKQDFETTGRAPTRRSWGALGELVLGLNVEIARGAYATLEGAAQLYLLPMLDADSHKTHVQAAGSGRLSLGAGARF